MGVAGWLALILEILTSLPQIFETFKNLIDAIFKTKSRPIRQLRMRKFNEAYRHFKQTGDRTQLDALYNEICPDGNCEVPPPTARGYERK